MEQTALNTIAVGVFVITATSLAGPLLHVSPAIPAAATLGIFGLATLDVLTWDGRGIALFLDIFAAKAERQRVLHHEAGHFLAACLLGIPITSYSLSAWETFKQGQPGLGGVQFDTQSLQDGKLDIQEIPLILQRFATVWLAGTAAETVIYGKALGGESDRRQLREAWQLAGLPDNLQPQQERWALLQAKNLIVQHRESYDRLVAAMAQRKSIAECCQIVQQCLTTVDS
jgi:hypothetical protein